MASYVEIIRLFLSSQTLDFRKNTPAYAGNTSDPSSTIPVFRDHPRLRGEYGRLPVPLIVPVGSPPLARGIHARNKGIRDRIRITPACAGNTLLFYKKHQANRDHPRLRGEYQFRFPRFWWCKGSPPLARGIPPIDPHRTKDGRITPACAGNTVFFFISAIGEEDHPRLRGEYSRKCPTNHILRGSPPLARGIRHPPHSGGDLIRITPACAGNTPAEPQINHAARDHPRLRGEYDGWEEKDSCWGGSPPLARGILYQPYWRGTIHRITPACAGNTLFKCAKTIIL